MLRRNPPTAGLAGRLKTGVMPSGIDRRSVPPQPRAPMDLRILIADDHMLVRQALRKILEAVEGWRVVAEACDGNQAADLAVAERPDVAVLDFVMPGKNGVEAAEEIRRRAPGVPVLMLTMHA